MAAWQPNCSKYRSCFNGAAAFRPRMGRVATGKTDRDHLLQRGRGLPAADGADLILMSTPKGRFNGAAAFRPRMGPLGSKQARVVL